MVKEVDFRLCELVTGVGGEIARVREHTTYTRLLDHPCENIPYQRTYTMELPISPMVSGKNVKASFITECTPQNAH